MLTIKSNFNNFRDRQGQLYIAEDLDKLCKALVTSDIVNFPVKKEMSAGYTEAIAWKIAERLVLVENGKYLVINDISLQVANALTDLGIKPENIYLAYGKWKKNAVPDTDPTLYLLMKQYIKANIVETFNIIKLEEIFTLDIKFNGVIANPPYGKIGAQITEKIKDKINYEQYINLLPANDYKRVEDLHQFVRNMETIINGFKDASVTTHLCDIITEANDITVEEFEIAQYTDPQLDKYFRVLRTRDTFELKYTTNTPIDKIKTLDISKTVILGAKDVNHKHLPYSKNCVQYKWNVEESVDADWVEAKYACKSSGKTGQTSLFVIYLNSAEEKQALVNLLYGATGFKFIQKLWTAINVDSYCMPNKYLPKVKLHVGITWEEILADYGYTEAEITEVMADIENFKDMER